MARPREFDRVAVVAQAQQVFWRQGYAATSTEDLCAAMGLSRQSFYNAFGGKRGVFLEALARYVADSTDAFVARLEGAAGPLAGIEAMLASVAQTPAPQRRLGCMGIASVSEFGPDDADVRAVLAGAHERMRQALLRALARAREAGELDPAVDVAAAQAFLQASLAGIKLAAKTGAAPRELRGMAALAVRALAARGPA